MKPYKLPKPSTRRTIKEEARYYLQCQGYTATEQEIQRAMWRERKYSRSLTGWCIYRYLMNNQIARPIKTTATQKNDTSLSSS